MTKRRVSSKASDQSINLGNENDAKASEPITTRFVQYITAKTDFLPEKLRNFIVRSVLTFVLLAFLMVLIFGGFLLDFILIFGIAAQCYREVMRVGYNQYKHHCLPLFRLLGWYFFLTASYFAVGDLPITYFSESLGHNLHIFLKKYHLFISFSIFMIGIITFVLTLKKDYLRIQFGMLAWHNIVSFMLVLPAYCIFKNMRQGLIWVFLPMSLIIINDISAYMVGITIGRTPLIKLSPKKTWEGFIGGAIITMVSSVLICSLMMAYPYFYCSIGLTSPTSQEATCKMPPSFIKRRMELPDMLQKLVGNGSATISYCPMYKHALAIGMFVSLVAPFGGFLASGFKRAFKIKDFGHVFPGHGGMMDRMDCQFIITIFVNVYMYTFVKSDRPQKVVSMILKMNVDDQLMVFNLLKHALTENGLLQD